MSIPVMIVLLAGLVVSAAVCIVIRHLLKAAIALALVSAILAVIMFILQAPLAAVFELSVCAGLITVVFISAISMTRVRTKEELAELDKERRKGFVFLPVLLIALGCGLLFFLWPHITSFVPALTPGGESVQDVIWNKRQVDLLGQIVIILAGVSGVIVFFKEEAEK